MVYRFNDCISSYFDEKTDHLNELNLEIFNKVESIEVQNRLKLQKGISEFERTVEGLYNDENYSLGILENTLQKLSPLEILKRGYAKVEQNGNPIDKTKDVVLSSNLEIILLDGTIIAEPKKVEERK